MGSQQRDRSFDSMKRVLFVGAGPTFPAGAFDFLVSQQDQGPVSITGFFFCPIDFVAENSASYARSAGPSIRQMEKERQQLVDVKSLFAKECIRRGWDYTVHANEEQWNMDLFARETRFADLVVLGSETFYEGIDHDGPNLYLKEALRGAESPVMIVPTSFIAPEKVIIGYDGGKECLYATKQFCYQFPQYTELPAEIVYLKEGQSDGIPEIERIQEFARLHFSSVGIGRWPMSGDVFADVCNSMRSPALLVAGSYGRSSISYIIRKSFARRVIHDHEIPVFIAHH